MCPCVYLLLSAQFTIGALMKNLDSSAGGIYAYHDTADAANDRVVITYNEVPAGGSSEPNTLQIAIYRNGTIEMNIGELANIGTAVSPGILGTLGIAGGHSKIADLASIEPINFSDLRDNGSVMMPFNSEAAIFEQFYAGTDRSCGKAGKKNKHKK